MARAALPGRLTWQLARVVDVVRETERATSLVLEAPDWRGHRAGQHIDLRLTAQDGYQAQRSYSLASAPEDEHLRFTVERIENGEVSPYLTDVVERGDQLELRGPVGGYFVWEASLPGPVLLVAGGAGIAPLRAMLRHWEAAQRPVMVRLLLSARAVEDVIYRSELLELAEHEQLDLHVALTRTWPDDWKGHRGRIDRELLAGMTWPPADHPRTYVCGPTGFVEAAASALVDLGQAPQSIRTERFGPTGG